MNLELIFGDELLDRDDLVNNDPWSLASKVGVTILSNKDLLASFVDLDENRVIAAVFHSYYNNEYAFDVVVDFKYQRQGIGKELIEIAMEEFESIKDMDPDVELKLEVINPNLVNFLERQYGIKTKQDLGDRVIMGFISAALDLLAQFSFKYSIDFVEMGLNRSQISSLIGRVPLKGSYRIVDNMIYFNNTRDGQAVFDYFKMNM